MLTVGGALVTVILVAAEAVSPAPSTALTWT